MCMKSPKAKAPAILAQPEKVATPDEQVGAARKTEDEELFGGTPDLRVDRSLDTTAVQGSGLTIPE